MIDKREGTGGRDREGEGRIAQKLCMMYVNEEGREVALFYCFAIIPTTCQCAVVINNAVPPLPTTQPPSPLPLPISYQV